MTMFATITVLGGQFGSWFPLLLEISHSPTCQKVKISMIIEDDDDDDDDDNEDDDNDDNFVYRCRTVGSE